MTFRDLIEGMHARDPAVRGGALAGADGLTVEEWRAPASADDLPALCAEMVQFFRESGRITRENGLGAARELVLSGERGQVYIRSVTDDYFLLLVTEPGAIPGKCRFLLRQGSERARMLL